MELFQSTARFSIYRFEYSNVKLTMKKKHLRIGYNSFLFEVELCTLKKGR